MTPEKKLWIYLVETAGSPEAAQEMACTIILELLAGTSMGLLRLGKKWEEPK